MNKLSSGRFILTVVSALAFGYMATTKILDPKDSLQLITMVFVLYFTRNDRNGGQNVSK